MEPITRSEMLMDGQYVEPITRKEKILAGDDLEPVTREEYFLKKYRHSGGDVDVVQLTATENKTYTAPEGKAYNPVKVNVPEKQLIGLYADENKTYRPSTGYDGFSEVTVDVPTPPPVLQSLTANHDGYFVPSSGYQGFSEVTVSVPPILEDLSVTENGTYMPSSGYQGFNEVSVNVPLPNNAYLLESQKDDVVTIQHGAEFDMPKLIASIEPQQDLHGYDSPWVGGSGKNKLPLPAEQTINGVTLTHLSDGSIKLTGTPTANIYFDCFAGTFDSTAYVGYRFKVSYIGSSSGVSFRISGSNRASMQDLYDNSVIADNGSGLYFALRVAFDATIPSSGIIIYPMLLSSSETNYDFAPYSNICPISGWTACNVVRTGKNLVNWKWNTFNDGKMEIFLKGGTYTLSAESTLSNGNAYIRGTKPSGEYVSREELGLIDWGISSTSGVYYGGGGQQTYTFNIPNGGAKIEFGKLNNNGTISAQLEFGSSATTYEPYNGNTYTINFVDGSNPLTVYGGTLDVLSGLLTVDRKKIVLTDTDYTWNSGSWAGGYRYFTTNRITDANNNQTCQSSIYKKNTQLQEQGIAIDTAVNSNQIDVRTQHFSSLSSWKTYLASNPVDVVYELATPQTYQLTPTEVKSLLGVNSIYADTGEVDVQIWTKEV